MHVFSTPRKLLVALGAAAVIGLALPAASFAWKPWPHSFADPPANRHFARGCVMRAALSRPLRLLKVCVPPISFPVHNPSQLAAANIASVEWCVLVNSRPGAPAGTLLSLASAGRWCKSRHWFYVRV